MSKRRRAAPVLLPESATEQTIANVVAGNRERKLLSRLGAPVPPPIRTAVRLGEMAGMKADAILPTGYQMGTKMPLMAAKLGISNT